MELIVIFAVLFVMAIVSLGRNSSGYNSDSGSYFNSFPSDDNWDGECDCDDGWGDSDCCDSWGDCDCDSGGDCGGGDCD